MEKESDRCGRAAPPDVVIDEATREKQRRVMSTFGGVLNLMTAFAAPRYLARASIPEPVPRAQLLSLFDDFIALMDGPARSEKDSRILDVTRRMRHLLDDWSFGTVATPPMVRTAREFMDAFGIPEPDQGWDAWEPAPEEGSVPVKPPSS